MTDSYSESGLGKHLFDQDDEDDDMNMLLSWSQLCPLLFSDKSSSISIHNPVFDNEKFLSQSLPSQLPLLQAVSFNKDPFYSSIDSSAVEPSDVSNSNSDPNGPSLDGGSSTETSLSLGTKVQSTGIPHSAVGFVDREKTRRIFTFLQSDTDRKTFMDPSDESEEPSDGIPARKRRKTGSVYRAIREYVGEPDSVLGDRYLVAESSTSSGSQTSSFYPLRHMLMLTENTPVVTFSFFRFRSIFASLAFSFLHMETFPYVNLSPLFFWFIFLEGW